MAASSSTSERTPAFTARRMTAGRGSSNTATNGGPTRHASAATIASAGIAALPDRTAITTSAAATPPSAASAAAAIGFLPPCTSPRLTIVTAAM